jgi:hypothetical protein
MVRTCFIAPPHCGHTGALGSGFGMGGYVGRGGWPCNSGKLRRTLARESTSVLIWRKATGEKLILYGRAR